MKRVIHYLPRFLAASLVLFFGVFILEGFGPGFNWRDSVASSIVTLIIAGITLVAWQRPQIGSWLFILLGLFFSGFFHPFFWVGFVIGGVTIVTGLLFLFDSFPDKTFKPKVKLTLYIIIGLIATIVLIYLAIFGRALRQSDNHLGIFFVLPEAIYRSEAVKIDDQNYLARNTTSFIKTVKKQGFSHVEQMGSGHFLEKDGNRYLSTSHMYSSRFMIFTAPVLVGSALPSQPANHEYQIAEITDKTCSGDGDCETPFEYAIRSSCPYQGKCLDGKCAVICPTPADAAWFRLSQAIANCEVKSVMQAHSQLVTAKLKNGQELKVVEPKIDDIFELTKQAEKKCGQIIMATE